LTAYLPGSNLKLKKWWEIISSASINAFLRTLTQKYDKIFGYILLSCFCIWIEIETYHFSQFCEKASSLLSSCSWCKVYGCRLIWANPFYIIWRLHNVTSIRLNRLISENVTPKFDLTWFQCISGIAASIFLEITGSSVETMSLFSTKARMPSAPVWALP